jgi:hypothetical protein
MRTDFRRRISSDYSPPELWQKLADSLRHSRSSALWPNEIEEVYGESLRKGGLLHAIYHGFGMRRHATYELLSFDPNGHSFRYEATPKHPLEGGGSVRVKARPDGSSVLEWSGSYSYPWYSLAGLYLRTYFLQNFFHKLEAGIRAEETLNPPARRRAAG